jgi:hypothetical protein
MGSMDLMGLRILRMNLMKLKILRIILMVPSPNYRRHLRIW